MIKIFEINGKFGLEENGATLYEASFSKKIALAIVKMENSKNQPGDWFETKERLIKLGFTENELTEPKKKKR